MTVKTLLIMDGMGFPNQKDGSIDVTLDAIDLSDLKGLVRGVRQYVLFDPDFAADFEEGKSKKSGKPYYRWKPSSGLYLANVEMDIGKDWRTKEEKTFFNILSLIERLTLKPSEMFDMIRNSGDLPVSNLEAKIDAESKPDVKSESKPNGIGSRLSGLMGAPA